MLRVGRVVYAFSSITERIVDANLFDYRKNLLVEYPR